MASCVITPDMEPGLVIFIAGIFGVMGASAGLIFLDYHRRSNVHKAIIFTAFLLAAVVLTLLMPPGVLLAAALVVPMLLLAYVLIARRR